MNCVIYKNEKPYHHSFRTEPFLQDFSIAFHEKTQSIGLNIKGDSKYFLQLSNIRTDTFTAKFVITGVGECCPQYGLAEARMNDHALCIIYFCNEVFEIEI